ncbi:MAG: glycosyltransferase family protein [Rhodocyclales bacterium]|nr:glycosyltransferase family protein [Rhodocyclales bacterium]
MSAAIIMIVSILLGVAWLVLAIPVLVLAVQVFSAMRPRAVQTAVDCDRPRMSVLMPAHNESEGVRYPIALVLAQLRPGDRLLVIADNCTDDTAQIAREEGAEVVVRHDPAHRGKGYALDFGMRHLEMDGVAPHVVVIVDADCEVGLGALEKISKRSMATGRPVQALYLMHNRPQGSRRGSIAEFAWLVKNLVRPLGFHHLGLPCQLMGTGMAFPWPLIRTASLASGHIVEDMQMGIDLARVGAPPLFCPDAMVLSYFPSNTEGARSQRTRWEHGHLGVIVGQVPSLLLEGLLKPRIGLLALALDLSVPPIALLAMLLAALSALSLVATIAGLGAWPLVTAASLCALFGIAVLAAWHRFGRQAVSAAELAQALGYACGKLPLYLRFLVSRQVEWVRSKRDAN